MREGLFWKQWDHALCLAASNARNRLLQPIDASGTIATYKSCNMFEFSYRSYINGSV